MPSDYNPVLSGLTTALSMANLIKRARMEQETLALRKQQLADAEEQRAFERQFRQHAQQIGDANAMANMIQSGALRVGNDGKVDVPGFTVGPQANPGLRLYEGMPIPGGRFDAIEDRVVTYPFGRFQVPTREQTLRAQMEAATAMARAKNPPVYVPELGGWRPVQALGPLSHMITSENNAKAADARTTRTIEAANTRQQNQETFQASENDLNRELREKVAKIRSDRPARPATPGQLTDIEARKTRALAKAEARYKMGVIDESQLRDEKQAAQDGYEGEVRAATGGPVEHFEYPAIGKKPAASPVPANPYRKGK
jgi:hypothetical protein